MHPRGTGKQLTYSRLEVNKPLLTAKMEQSLAVIQGGLVTSCIAKAIDIVTRGGILGAKTFLPKEQAVFLTLRCTHIETDPSWQNHFASH